MITSCVISLIVSLQCKTVLRWPDRRVPWFDDDSRKARSECRWRERRYRRSHSSVNRWVVEFHGHKANQYADDCQVYRSSPVSDAEAAVNDFSRCVGDLSPWLSASRLRLNPAKTVVMWLGAKQYVARVTVNSVQIMSIVVPVVDSVRDLGVDLATSPCLLKSTRFAVQCFTNFVNSDQSSVPSPQMQPSVCILKPGLLQLTVLRHLRPLDTTSSSGSERWGIVTGYSRPRRCSFRHL